MRFEDLKFGPHTMAREASEVLPVDLTEEQPPGVSDFHAVFRHLTSTAVSAHVQFENGWEVSVVSHEVPDGAYRMWHGNLLTDPPTYEVMASSKSAEGLYHWQTPEQVSEILQWVELQEP